MSLIEFDDHPGDAVAVSVAGVSLTWAELAAAAGALAGRIRGAGVVALAAQPSVDTVIGLVGALRAGVTVVPVPPDSGPRERRHIIGDSRARAWLGDAVRDGDTGAEVIPIPRSGLGPAPAEPEPADGVALVLYTSGTTGAPKGVPLTRAALRAGIDGLSAAWAWTPEDVLVHGLPLFHVHGLVLGILGPLRIGGRVIHTGRPTPEAYAAAGGSLYFGVPTVWSRVAADPASARALRSARLLVSGSAGLPEPVFRDLAALCGQGPVERYGMTETLITLAARADRARRPGWVGGPIDGVAARLVDDDGAAVGADGATIANLEVRGATVFAGYLDRPEATAAAFTADGWFRTGDAAVQAPDGQFRIVGRAKDDLIKSGGYRIGAGEIEACLLDHAGVREAAVIGVPDADLGQRIVAYVVGDGLAAQPLIEHVARELSVHKRPREVRIVADLPRNAMGKVQKSLLGETP